MHPPEPPQLRVRPCEPGRVEEHPIERRTLLRQRALALVDRWRWRSQGSIGLAASRRPTRPSARCGLWEDAVHLAAAEQTEAIGRQIGGWPRAGRLPAALARRPAPRARLTVRAAADDPLRLRHESPRRDQPTATPIGTVGSGCRSGIPTARTQPSSAATRASCSSAAPSIHTRSLASSVALSGRLPMMGRRARGAARVRGLRDRWRSRWSRHSRYFRS
jgi:hypothetical protein